MTSLQAGSIRLIAWLAFATFGFSQSASAGTRARDPYVPLESFADALFFIQQHYVDDVESSDLVYSAIQGMTIPLDVPSVYMSPDEYQRFREDTIGRYYGVGILTIIDDDAIRVEKVFANSPAERAGLLEGAVIAAIDGEFVTPENVQTLIDGIKGERGTLVHLKVRREGEADLLEFGVSRDRIRTPSVEWERLPEGLGWLRILQFQENTGREVRRALAALDQRKNPLRGLVLDLRANPGGFLDEAVAVADIFIEEGTIVTSRGRAVAETRQIAHAQGTRRDLPLVVLQDETSASAAEIVAAALQDHERATILGTTSYGKGSVQTTYEFADGSALKLTIARFYTPNGRTIQGMGVEPDVVVDRDDEPWIDENGLSVYSEGLDLSPMPAWVVDDAQMCAAVTTILQTPN